jgi:hypothetical protein
MNAILNKYNEEQARRPPPRPDPARCTGCHDAFRVDDDDDDEGVTPTDECPDCGYMACESCSCHHSRGTYRSLPPTRDECWMPMCDAGSCYCTNSNFGRKYCGMGEFSLLYVDRSLIICIFRSGVVPLELTRRSVHHSQPSFSPTDMYRRILSGRLSPGGWLEAELLRVGAAQVQQLWRDEAVPGREGLGLLARMRAGAVSIAQTPVSLHIILACMSQRALMSRVTKLTARVSCGVDASM